MSTFETVAEEALVVLLVDDQETALKYRKDLFEASGLTALVVSTRAAALREFRAAPLIDVVVTDINLDPSRRKDKSGVDLARRVRSLNPTVPIIGYSAAIAEDDLSGEERGVFDKCYPRGSLSPSEIVQHVEETKRIAREHRLERMKVAKNELERLRQKYGGSFSEFETLRFLVTTAHLHPGGEKMSVDEALRAAGYRLRLIEPGSTRPRLDQPDSVVSSPILIWLKTDMGVTVSEVYGYPELYSYGNDDDDAINNVLLLMDGFYRELVENVRDASKELGPAVLRMSDFLRQVFR